MSRYGRTLMSFSRVVDALVTTYKRVKAGQQSRPSSPSRGGLCEQRLRLERDGADRAVGADRRHWLAVDRDLQTAGIAGAHRHPRPIGHQVAFAGLQHPREERGLVGAPDLYPAVGRSPDDDPGRSIDGAVSVRLLGPRPRSRAGW